MKLSFLTLIISIFIINQSLYSQNEAGLPLLQNFYAKEYGASPQNWGIVQDSNGIIYIANNSGVLEYDGINWRMISVTNRSAVGSLAIDSLNIIYVGATGEFGYLKPDSAGLLKYVSLMPKIETRYHDFADVWHTLALAGKVYFQSYKYIFSLDGDSVTVIHPQKMFHRSYAVNNRLIVRQRGAGLVTLENGQVTLLPGTDIFRDEAVYAMIPYDPQRILVGTRKKNFFLYDGQTCSPFSMPADSFLSAGMIYFGILHNDHMIFSTRRSGVVILDRQGNITRNLNRQSGMIDEVINFTYIDDHRGLWMALNNGIGRAETFSPVSFFGENSGLKGIALFSLRHENILYVATGFGIYYLHAEQKNGRVPPVYRFKPISPIATQSWHLLSYSSSLLAATSEGIYEIRNNQARIIRKEGGGFFLYRSRRDSTLVFAGLRDGLACLRHESGQWKDLGRVPGVHVDGRVIVESPDGFLWIGTSFRGVTRIDLRNADLRTFTKQSLKSMAFPVTQFGTNDGLPHGGVFVFSAAGKLLFGTEKGLYGFDSRTQRFQTDSTLGTELTDSTRAIDVIVEDAQGNIWVHAVAESRSENYLFIRQSGGTYLKETAPFLRFADYSVLHIYPEESGVTWFGGADGLIRYDGHISQNHDQPFRTVIRKILIRRDSMVYGGHGPMPSEPVAFRNNALRFECAALYYHQPGANLYQFYMEGLDENWSGWSPEQNKEYTGLSEGAYRFRVRSKNIYGLTGSEAVFDFTVLPPWYRAWWAFLLYGLLFAGLLTAFARWRALKLEKEKHRLEELVEQRTRDLSRKTEQLEKINTIVKTINSEIELDRLLESLLSQLQTLNGVERIIALTWDDTRQSFIVLTARGWDIGSYQKVELSMQETEKLYAGHAEEIGNGIFVVRNFEDRNLCNLFHDARTPFARLIMRIYIRENIRAYFIFDNLSLPGAFSGPDIELFVQLKEHITLAFMKSKLLDELKLLNEKKNEFLGIAAHDLRSPLNVIVGFVSLIIEEIKIKSFDAETGLHDLEDVLKAAQGMTHLLSELLDISAIESGKVVLNRTPVFIRSVFEECSRNHSKIAAQKNIALIFDSPPDHPPFSADQVRIVSALDNLISNAIKYTYPGGTVLVSAKTQNGCLLISVSDNGQGLDEDDLKVIFHSFRKLSARPTGGESSTGLGLAIVKKIVEMHGGAVTVNSEKGKGSTFTFTLNCTEN